ncbi:MAG: hypothetical protein ABH826_03465 [Patescibacteria group bacterium]
MKIYGKLKRITVVSSLFLMIMFFLAGLKMWFIPTERLSTIDKVWQMAVRDNKYEMIFDDTPTTIRFLCILLLAGFGYSIPWIIIYSVMYVRGNNDKKNKDSC